MYTRKIIRLLEEMEELLHMRTHAEKKLLQENSWNALKWHSRIEKRLKQIRNELNKERKK